MNTLNNANFNDYLNLNPKQQECIRLLVGEGLYKKDIAKKIKVSAQTISTWEKDEKFKSGKAGYNAHYLSNAVPEALRTMRDLLRAKSELVRFQAAKDILDRTGYVPVDKQEIEFTTPTFVNNVPLDD
ncbi:DNA-binding protein [Macrococcus sp. DPC7161]|uniref:DNA-binding protein n=1 Tax=Macrococcus sp. DPC7161 TaxID=2507060 RepID=UPI00100B66FC|nr:DNA-binding protein [Macrococcus sp. DPC7161]RXK19084.1 DNA-binding protein [Macrococcus sp. DPC7161]